MSRNYGRAPRGKRAIVKRPGRRYKRINIVAGQVGNEVIALRTYDWPTTAAWYEVWFEWYYCPLLNPGTYIIMDNARFHRKAQLERIASFYGHHILWLPTYSPDLNKIEHLWANLKNWLRLHSKDYPSIQDAISAYFE